MPSFCAVVGCANRGERDNVRFFRIPAALNDRGIKLETLSGKRRQEWIRALKRDSLSDTFLKNARICSKHFVSGCPANLEDDENPDWIPTLYMGYVTVKQQTEQSVQRHERSKKRLKRTEENQSFEVEPGPSTEPDLEVPFAEPNMEVTAEKSNKVLIDVEELNTLLSNLTFCNETIHNMKQKLNLLDLTEDTFINNDNKTNYYTGFPDSRMMFVIFQKISSYLSTKKVLSPFQQYLLTLMKLRLNLPFKYLAYRFGVSPTTASNTFYTCIDVLYEKFKRLVFWPDREIIKKTMPSCFKKKFKDKVMIIIDCFEIFTENPSGLINAAQCWSNYKHHETVKYLIGITPQGTIAYISEGWGGRTSDKHLTENCGFLNLILPGDFVMADRGFLIEDSVKILGGHLEVPVYTRGKTQLHPTDIEHTRKIANVRIHVERVIGLLRRKYQICKGPIPISMLSASRNEMNALDKIIHVCSVFINLCPSVIPKN